MKAQKVNYENPDSKVLDIRMEKTVLQAASGGGDVGGGGGIIPG